MVTRHAFPCIFNVDWDEFWGCAKMLVWWSEPLFQNPLLKWKWLYLDIALVGILSYVWFLWPARITCLIWLPRVLFHSSLELHCCRIINFSHQFFCKLHVISSNTTNQSLMDAIPMFHKLPHLNCNAMHKAHMTWLLSSGSQNVLDMSFHLLTCYI